MRGLDVVVGGGLRNSVDVEADDLELPVTLDEGEVDAAGALLELAFDVVADGVEHVASCVDCSVYHDDSRSGE